MKGNRKKKYAPFFTKINSNNNIQISFDKIVYLMGDCNIFNLYLLQLFSVK